MRRSASALPFSFCVALLLDLRLLLAASASYAQTVPPGQVQVADSTVLRQFYDATRGDNWTNLTKWLQGTSLD